MWFPWTPDLYIISHVLPQEKPAQAGLTETALANESMSVRVFGVLLHNPSVK